MRRVSVGGVIYYGLLERWRFGLAAYQDVLTRNTAPGLTVAAPITFLF